MKKLVFLSLVVGFALTLTCVTSCKKNEDPVVVTLYDSLGGTAMVADPRGGMIEKGRLGIRNVVDSTIFVIAFDNRINSFFSTLLAEYTATPQNLTGFFALEKSLTDFFCVNTGAKNFTYSGKNMVAAHDPAQHTRMNGKSSNEDFDAFVQDLVKGAQQVGLTNDLIIRIGRVVATTRTQVVQR
jgi:hypothetical protein